MWEYEHKISARSRSLRLKISALGKLTVSTPPRVSSHQIQHFLDQHAPWIQQHLALIQSRRAEVNHNLISIFGKFYQASLEQTTTQPIGVQIIEGKLQINAATPILNLKAPVAQKMLIRFLKRIATHYLSERTTALATLMATNFQKITLREQTSRWGSCSSSGNLNFNWRLVHFPTNIIDYVIIHELAHRHHLNHSAAFWQVVARFDPEYSKHRGWLKRDAAKYLPE